MATTVKSDDDPVDEIAAKENTRYRGHIQPPYTRRLQQIQNYLADEDVYRGWQFVHRFAQIEQYLMHLERNEKSNIGPANVAKLEEIKEMIAIHRNWIGDKNQVKTLTFDYASFQGTDRLEPLEKIVELKKIYKDTPYQLPRPRGFMKEVALALPIPLKDRPKERDPFLYTKALAALRLKQDNLAEQFRAEQNLLRGNDMAYIPAPVNFNGPYLPTRKTEAEKKLAGRHQHLLEIIRTLTDAEVRAPRPLIRDVLLQIQRGVTTSTAPADADSTQSAATVISQEEIDRLLVLSEPSWSTRGQVLHFDKRAVFEELEPEGGRRLRGTYDRLMSFAKNVEESFNDENLWPIGHSDILAAHLRQYLNSGRSQTVAYSRGESDLYLECMTRAARLTYSRTTRRVSKPLLDAHPEHRFCDFLAPGELKILYSGTGLMGKPIILPHPQFEEIALRLGHEIRSIAERLAEDGNPAGEQAPAAAALKAYVTARISPEESLIGIARSLAGPNSSRLTEAQAAELVQAKIVEEHNRNWDERRAPKWSKLWAFANSKPKKIYFSLDRWPLQLQTQERQNQIRSIKLKPAVSPEMMEKMARTNQDENLDWIQWRDHKRVRDWKNREKWYRGEASFPFGETVWQQAWLSHEFDKDLKDSKSTLHWLRIKHDDSSAQRELLTNTYFVFSQRIQTSI